MNSYIGVIEFDKPLCCQKEVSGKHFNTRIAGTNVLIIFPSIPDNYNPDTYNIKNGDLVVPRDLFKGQVSWGMVHSWPEGLFSVNRALCSFLAEDECVDAIYSEFRRWKEKINYLHLIETGNYIHPQQKHSAILRGGGFYDGLQLFQVTDSKTLHHMINPHSETIQVHFFQSGEAYSIDKATNLFSNAGNSKEIALAYELLITAYQAMERHDFRSAVILGGSAVEKAILNRIAKEFSCTEAYEAEREKHRMLGGKFRWLSELNINIPITNYKTSIVDVRNAATHDGIRPDLSTTRTCLENCKKLIEIYQPEVLEQ